MTLEQFYELKAQIKADLEYKLKTGKLNSVHTKSKYIDVLHDDITNLRLVNLYISKGYKPTMFTKTKDILGGTRNIGTTYRFELPESITQVTEEMVQRYMRKAITNIIAKQLGKSKYYISLECKVMELFKSGIIDWNQVLESHKNGCSL